MLERIRKHQKWLWFFLIAVTIVTFVIFFTPTVGRQRVPTARGVVGVVFGRNVTVEEFRDIQREVYLGFYLTYGILPDDARARTLNFDPIRQTQQRIILIEMARRAGIEVDNTAVAEWVRTRLGDPDRPGSARQVYESLLNSQILQRLGMDARAFNEFVKHEVMISQLRDTAALLGLLVVPREARERYRKLHERFSTTAVVFSATNYWDQVSLTDADLIQYYSNHLARYRIPERVAVYYVKFAFTNYQAAAEQELKQQTNLEELIEQEYLRRGTNSFTDASGKPLPPEQAKERIREQLKEQKAQLLARREAAQFGTKVFDQEPWSTDSFLKLAKEAGLEVHETEPFTEATGPRGLPSTREMLQAVFELNETRPFTRPILLRDGVYIFALKERLPSEIPPFEQVKERVQADAHADKALELAREAARKFREELVKQLQSGRSFEEICKQAAIEPIKLPPFTFADPIPDDWPPQVSFQQVRAVVSDMNAGEVSQMLPTPNGAMLVYLEQRTEPSPEEIEKGLKEMIDQIRRSNIMAAFQDWFEYHYRLGEIKFAQSGRSSNGASQ